MPEMHVLLRWPDQAETRCYSPSVVIRDYLAAGTDYPLAEFLVRARTALAVASDRVRLKYGFACTRADAQLEAIEARAAAFDPQATVAVVGYEGPEPDSREVR